MGVKSYNGCIYAFVSVLGIELRVYKFNPDGEHLSWDLECNFSPGYTVGGINQVIRYDEVNQKFYLFRYNYMTGGYMEKKFLMVPCFLSILVCFL